MSQAAPEVHSGRAGLDRTGEAVVVLAGDGAATEAGPCASSPRAAERLGDEAEEDAVLCRWVRVT
jgi:hypothetical protein